MAYQSSLEIASIRRTFSIERLRELQRSAPLGSSTRTGRAEGAWSRGGAPPPSPSSTGQWWRRGRGARWSPWRLPAWQRPGILVAREPARLEPAPPMRGRSPASAEVPVRYYAEGVGYSVGGARGRCAEG